MSTGRSLAEVNHKLLKNSRILETTLSDLLAKGRPLKVLEVGFGQGRALMELARHFRNDKVTLYGVDKTQAPPVEKREDLRHIARLYDIVPEAELADVELPEIFFYDATRLHFDEASVDLVYSAVTIRFIEHKAEFLEEICRVLKPGGVALLHYGEANWNYPYSLICDNRILTPYTNRFVLKYGEELIPLPSYLKLFEEDAFRFDFLKTSGCVIRVSKFKPARLHLRLLFNHELSISMKTLPYRHGSGKPRGGVRSVYDVRPEIYRALFERGLLSRDQMRTDIKLSENSQTPADHEED
jgi:ubiquinone/menaquinone biosynthesis C-methylase UbiE